ncbi:hypothetical protein OY671_005347 [Metschnikowia pulcherrima]|nr:hypothetical protein OY671_005347 [Metschnikowia pulcherrima]
MSSQRTQSTTGSGKGSSPRSISTPSTSRRNSFLSENMMKNETSLIYDAYTFSRGLSSYHVISLRESQGFLFNQDLFASTYQQSRTLMKERQALRHSKKRSKSHSSAVKWHAPQQKPHRRHTTYGQAPLLRTVGDESAVDEGSSDEMCVEGLSNTSDQANPPNLQKSISFSEPLERARGAIHGEGRNAQGIATDHDEDNSDSSEMSDAPETLDFSPIGSNYVPVIDILVDDMDHVPDL